MLLSLLCHWCRGSSNSMQTTCQNPVSLGHKGFFDGASYVEHGQDFHDILSRHPSYDIRPRFIKGSNKKTNTPWKINGWNLQPSPMKRKENDLNQPNLHGIMFQLLNLQGGVFQTSEQHMAIAWVRMPDHDNPPMHNSPFAPTVFQWTQWGLSRSSLVALVAGFLVGSYFTISVYWCIIIQTLFCPCYIYIYIRHTN